LKKTFAHISVALESDIGVPALLTLVEAHEENWEASTTAPQIYETTIELQKAGFAAKLGLYKSARSPMADTEAAPPTSRHSIPSFRSAGQ
jgi:hypothetical protein